ncbi:Hypothetical predicted protein [Mytilus galloprovincialis]|uniref:Transglutaminase C-terminal domain-containing protein n=1 Tax=Mytilus galloprovincialis TaxID=29158 RepID=A0A8B6BIX3_MYTGA|nr:Hypothetical predicted protein [Mytilus galloprovincialis]
MQSCRLPTGVYRCGPAPVTAIKRGELGIMQCDLPFVLAEVNADVIRCVKLSSTKWEKLDVDTSRVGKNICTKEPDGTLEERLAVQNAGKASKKVRQIDEAEHMETFKFTLKPDDYLDHLTEQYMMNITATAQVKETGKVHIKEEDYRLRRPDIEVEAPKSGKRYKPFEINVSMKNPLSKPMTKCVVHVEANGNVEEKISDIAANSTWKHSITIKANRSGRITMNVTLDCQEIKDVTGYANVEIEP